MKILRNILLFAVIGFGLQVFVFPAQQAHAASFTVAAGNDENTDNASCSLTEAIENINNQDQTNTDCPAADGNNDTINLPSGTITLTANLPQITESVSIVGQGMDDSVVHGDGTYTVFHVDDTGAAVSVEITAITITAFYNVGILS